MESSPGIWPAPRRGKGTALPQEHMVLNFTQEDLVKWVNAALVATIAYFLLFRAFNLTPYLINKHSWGESQYAMWAAAYIKEGFIYGTKEIDRFSPFVNYLPIASFLAAFFSELFNTNLVFTGRVTSYLFSILAVLYVYRLAFVIFGDKFKALVTALIFVVLPLNMYYSGMIYNDPLHLFLIIYLTYLLISRRSGKDVPGYYSQVVVIAFLVLITKPTAAILFGFPMIYLYYREWKEGVFDSKEFVCISSVLSIVALFIIASRLLYPSGPTQEVGKMVAMDVISNVGHYAKRAWHQLSFHFHDYYYVFLAALPVAIIAERKIRFFVFMALGFFVFYFLFVKGALIHQYYSLPLLLPFSVVTAYGMFRYAELITKNRIVFVILVVAALVVFSPERRHLEYMFRPEYSKDIIYVVETINKLEGAKEIFVVAHGHKSFQYYLEVPSARIRYRWTGDESGLDLLRKENINILVVSNHKEYAGLIEELRGSDYNKIYCSDDFLVFSLETKGYQNSFCDKRFD